MKYYIYKPMELFLASIIATERSQITKTLEHYIEEGEKLSLPKNNQIYETESFSMSFILPLSSSRFNFKTEIMPGITLSTNANSIWVIKELAKNYTSLRRGELYKFTSTINGDGLYFLPEHVMIGIKNYDWTKHWDLLGQWEKVVEGMKSPKIGRLESLFDESTKKDKN